MWGCFALLVLSFFLPAPLWLHRLVSAHQTLTAPERSELITRKFSVLCGGFKSDYSRRSDGKSARAKGRLHCKALGAGCITARTTHRPPPPPHPLPVEASGPIRPSIIQVQVPPNTVQRLSCYQFLLPRRQTLLQLCDCDCCPECDMSGQSRPLRLLCLHGRHMNAKTFSLKTASVPLAQLFI